MFNLKKYFCLLLATIFLISCDSRECIEADDFGEWDTETIRVYASKQICVYSEEPGASDNDVLSCLGAEDVPNTAITTERLYGKIYNSQSVTNCKVEVKNQEITYFAIKELFTDTSENIDYALANHYTFSNCGSSRGEKLKILKEYYTVGVQKCMERCISNNDNTEFSYDKYEPSWQTYRVFSKGNGGIKMGRTQKIEIKAKGKITLIDPVEEGQSFTLMSYLLQDSNIIFKRKKPLSIEISSLNPLKINGNIISDVLPLRTLDEGKRIDTLRRTVLYIEPIPTNANLTEDERYVGDGPSLGFDEIRDNCISCRDGICSIKCQDTDNDVANNLAYRFDEGNTKSFGGQVIIPSEYAKVTSYPFEAGQLDNTKGNGFFVKSGANLTVNLNYPVKVAFRVFSSSSNAVCNVTVNSSGIVAKNQSAVVNKWKFLEGKNNVYNQYFVPNGNESYSITFSTSCADNVGILLLPQYIMYSAVSGFVEFKEIGGQFSNNLIFDIINPSIANDVLYRDNNFLEHTNSKSVNVSGASWSGVPATFVRKGQGIRFSEDSWFYISGNDSDGYDISSKESKFSNLVMLIKPRPALLCKGVAVEEFDNPKCTDKGFYDINNERKYYCKLDFSNSPECGDEVDNSSSLKCPTGCVLLSSANSYRITDRPITTNAGLNRSKVFRKGGDGVDSNVDYQVYYADFKQNLEYQSIGLDPGNTCSTPVRDGNGYLLDETNYSAFVGNVSKCEACYADLEKKQEQPIVTKDVVQCYDLEEYSLSVRNFTANNFSTLIDGVANIKDKIKKYGGLSATEYEKGARKLFGHVSSSTNYFSLEDLSADSLYLKDLDNDDNTPDEYEKIVYTTGTNSFSIQRPSKIKFLSLVHDNDFNFDTANEIGDSSNYGGAFTLLYQSVPIYENGERLAIVVAKDDWVKGGASIPNVKRPIPIEYDFDNSSATYGSRVKSLSSMYDFLSSGFLVSTNGARSYVVDDLMDTSSDDYDNLRLFFKIIDRKHTASSSCVKKYQESKVGIRYSCDNINWSTNYPVTNSEQGCGYKKKDEVCKKSSVSAGSAVNTINRDMLETKIDADESYSCGFNEVDIGDNFCCTVPSGYFFSRSSKTVSSSGVVNSADCFLRTCTSHPLSDDGNIMIDYTLTDYDVKNNTCKYGEIRDCAEYNVSVPKKKYEGEYKTVKVSKKTATNTSCTDKTINGINYSCVANQPQNTSSWNLIESNCPTYSGSSLKDSLTASCADTQDDVDEWIYNVSVPSGSVTIDKIEYAYSSALSQNGNKYIYVESECGSDGIMNDVLVSNAFDPSTGASCVDDGSNWKKTGYKRSIDDNTRRQMVYESFGEVSGECKDIYEGNTGSYLISIRAPRNFRKPISGASLFGDDPTTNLASYITAAATGLFMEYFVSPTMEAFNGKSMSLMKTVISSPDDPVFVECNGGNDCFKYQATGWKKGCAKGDELCYAMDKEMQTFVPCDDEIDDNVARCRLKLETNEFGPICKAGVSTPSSCVKLCDSSITTNDCGLYIVATNNKLTYDPNFGDRCTSGEGCYRACNKSASSEVRKTQCVTVNDNGGFSKRFYIKVVTSHYYQDVLKIALAMMFSFYALYTLMGFSDLTHTELINRIAKIGFIYLFVGATGWKYYERFFVSFFRDGIDYVMFAVTSAFDQTGEVASAFQAQDFSNKSLLFASFDKNISLIFSSEVSYKIFGLLFVSFFGWFYVMLIYSALTTYVFTGLNIVLSYIISQLFTSILLGFGPIFFVTLIFNKTKEMFTKWINTIVSFAGEQVLLLTSLSLFNTLMYMAIKSVLSFKVCWRPLLVFNLPIIGSISILKYWKATASVTPSGVANSIPGLFRILILYIITDLMKELVSTASSIGNTFGGSGLSTYGSGGLGGKMAGELGKAEKEIREGASGQVDKIGASIGRGLIGYKTDKEEEAEEKSNKKIRDGINSANSAGKEARNKFLARQKALGKDISDPNVLKEAAKVQKEAQEESLKSSGALDEYMKISGNKDAESALKELSTKKSSSFTGRGFGIAGNLIQKGWNSWGNDRSVRSHRQDTKSGNISIPDMLDIADQAGSMSTGKTPKVSDILSSAKSDRRKIKNNRNTMQTNRQSLGPMERASRAQAKLDNPKNNFSEDERNDIQQTIDEADNTPLGRDINEHNQFVDDNKEDIEKYNKYVDEHPDSKMKKVEKRPSVAKMGAALMQEKHDRQQAFYQKHKVDGQPYKGSKLKSNSPFEERRVPYDINSYLGDLKEHERNSYLSIGKNADERFVRMAYQQKKEAEESIDDFNNWKKQQK
jgi:type IV secretory pathway VirB6-like protein